MTEEAIVATPRDPAWPKGCTVTLWRLAGLPHGFIPEWSAYRLAETAKKAAEKDYGSELLWEECPQQDGYERVFRSEPVPYRIGLLSYVIQVWPSEVKS